MAAALGSEQAAAIYDTSGRTLFGERLWTAPELRELAKELLAAGVSGGTPGVLTVES
jgi:hypothetical protein